MQLIYRALFIGKALIFLAATVAQETSGADCAKATLLAGTSCDSLKVKFDASECDGEDETKEVVTTCEDGKGHARWKGVDAVYTAVFAEKEGSWGEKSWQGTAKVTVQKKKTRNHRTSNSPYGYFSARSHQEPSVYSPPVRQETSAPEGIQPSDKNQVASPPVEQAGSEVRQPASQTEVENPIKFSGYLDTYYTFNANKPANNLTRAAGATQNPAQNGPRYYDIYHDQLSLNLAEVSLSKDAKPVGFRFDLSFGQWAEQNIVNDEVSKHLSQAYFTFKPEALKNFTLDVGKMYTHAGLEVAHAQDNFNYSRSLLYGYALPFWHTGIKATYALIPDKLSGAFAVYNGWQTSLNDNNSGKTLGGQLLGSPLEGLTLIYNVVTGPELNGDNDTIRTAHDFNFTWALSQKVVLASDFVYGYENQGALSKKWSAFEILAKISPLDWYSFSPRFEIYNDKQDDIGGLGSLGLGATLTVWNLTLTNSFNLGHGLELRLEGRYDKASQSVYDSGLKDNQWTFTWAGLLKF